MAAVNGARGEDARSAWLPGPGRETFLYYEVSTGLSLKCGGLALTKVTSLYRRTARDSTASISCV